jgi:amino acid adenylation domain-containing protein
LDLEIDRLIQADFQKCFDLLVGPLLRIQFLKYSHNKHIFLLTMHHIISDDWSIKLLIKEIFAIYFALVNERSFEIRKLEVQYKDYVEWQNDMIESGKMNDSIQYWKQQLKGVPVLLLPTDFVRASVMQSKGALEKFEISFNTAKKLIAISKKEEVSLFMVLLAVFKIMLLKYTNQNDICVGIPFSERPRIDFEEIIGLFVNTLAIRTQINETHGFLQMLKQLKENVLEAFMHGNVPFEKVVEEVQVERKPDSNPIFQAMFSFFNNQNMITELNGLKLSALEIDNKTSKLDLTLFMYQDENGLYGTIEYRTDLFKKSAIENMAGHYCTLLEKIVDDLNIPISEISLLNREEYQKIVCEWNNTKKEYGNPVCLQEFFEAQVLKTPERIALIDEIQSLTYREFNKKANQLAHYLRCLGVGPEVLVGICIERSIHMVVSIYAVLKAGGAYVPIDPEYPVDRLNMITEDANVSLILTQDRFKQFFQAIDIQLVSMDSVMGLIESQPTINPSIITTGENLAYVIYTSGSTGKPKGAMNKHESVSNCISWMLEKFPLAELDKVLLKTPLTFDVSGWELFWPIFSGASLVIAKPEGHKDPSYLIRTIQEHKITNIVFVPSLLNAFLDDPDLSCPSLIRVLSIGEALTTEVQKKFFEKVRASLYNLYGPAEAAIHVTCWDCQRNSRLRTVPIGKPIANTSIYILDKYLNPLPQGIPGELYIGGIHVSRGYLNRPQLNEEKFIKNPFDQENKSHLYKTGDLAKYMSDGNIEFLGRIDHQVKMRGLRIELGEIECALKDFGGIKEAIVLCREDRGGDQRLVAYFTSYNAIRVEEIKTFLLQKLPEYMVPNDYVCLATFPLLMSGKIDRKALPKPELPMDNTMAFTAPETEIEKKIAGIWMEVLELTQIDVNQKFFDVGGNSLLLLKVQSKLKQVMMSNISVVDLFKWPTVRMLAAYLTEAEGMDKELMEKSENRAELRKQSMDRNHKRQALKINIRQNKAWEG